MMSEERSVLDQVSGFSPALLKREASRSDFIVLPLAAAVLAHLVLITRPVGEDAGLTKLQVDAQALLDSVDADDAGEQSGEFHACVLAFVVEAWSVFASWLPVNYYLKEFEEATSFRGSSYYEGALKWLRGHPHAALLDCMLLAALATDILPGDPDEIGFLARPARSMRVVLADRLRALGDSSWRGIMRAVRAEWTPESLGRFAFRLSEAASHAIDLVGAVGRNIDAMNAETASRAKDAVAKPAPPAEDDSRVAELLAAREALRQQGERYRALEQKLAASIHEKAAIAEREGRRLSRIEALTAKLESSEERVREREQTLASVERERDQLASLFDKDDEPVATATPLPPDALRGRRVILFTGEAAGDARAELERSFYKYGAADVTVFDSDRGRGGRGPARFPNDAIVVLDVRYMSHSTYDALASTARQSQVAWYPIRRAASLIAYEIVRRWLAEHGASRLQP